MSAVNPIAPPQGRLTGAVGPGARPLEMNGRSLCFFLRENDRHGRMRLYRWLLLQALRCGLPGGTARRTVCGFGRHRYFHDARMVELSLNLAVRVEFLVSNAQARLLLDAVQSAHPAMIYELAEAKFGVTGGSEDEIAATDGYSRG